MVSKFPFGKCSRKKRVPMSKAFAAEEIRGVSEFFFEAVEADAESGRVDSTFDPREVSEDEARFFLGEARRRFADVF